MDLSFVLIDHSTTTDPDLGGQLTRPTLEQIADALQAQLNDHVSHEWGGRFEVRADDDISSAQEVAVYIVNSFDDPALTNAAAYHTTGLHGVPCCFASRADFSSLTSGYGALSVGLSHELVETAVDPACNRWADRRDGTEEALEACDRLQGSCYQIGDVTMADFLLQSAFCPDALRPFTWVELTQKVAIIDHPFAKTPDGYAALRSVGRVLANQMHHALPESVAGMKHLIKRLGQSTSRTYRRAHK